MATGAEFRRRSRTLRYGEVRLRRYEVWYETANGRRSQCGASRTASVTACACGVALDGADCVPDAVGHDDAAVSLDESLYNVRRPPRVDDCELLEPVARDDAGDV